MEDFVKHESYFHMLTFVKSTGGHKLKPVKLTNNVFSEGRRQLISDPDLPEHQAHRCAHLPSPERFMSHVSARWRRISAPSTGIGEQVSGPGCSGALQPNWRIQQ